MLYIVSDTPDKARAWMKVRKLQPTQAVIVTEPLKAGRFTKNDRVAYVGQFWLNPYLREIQDKLGNVAANQIEGIADDERGDLTRILRVTA